MGELSKTTINGVSYDFKDAGAARQSHSHTKSQITDFPTLGTAASKNVPSSGNASTSQVVMGNDSRLSDARTPTSHTHTKSQITDFPTSMPASDVYSWAKQSSKPSYTASEVGAIATSAKGAANGVASLDSAGKVPSSQLPSYVDDVLEYSAKSSFPNTGETGKIYVDTSTNKTYRWSGSAYVEISASLALGETSSTAYYGDKGKTAYSHSQVTSGNPHNVTKSDVGLGNVGNFKAVSTVASQGLSSTEKSNARANIGAGTSSFSGSYNDLSNKPTLGTAAAKDVPSSGNASTSQVVMGNDSRLSDARTPTSHTHTKSQITDFPTSMTPTSHTHGNIQNGGTLQSNDISIASGDKLVVTDSSDSNKIARASISFDGSTTTQALTKAGTWATFGTSNLVIGTGASQAAAGNHTHGLSIDASTASSPSIKLAANKIYTLTAGGSTYTFKTPPDSNSVTGVKGNAESSFRTGQVNITPANIGAVPTSRTVNNKALSGNITLSASDVGAATSTHIHGSINHDGTLNTTPIGISNGDRMLITSAADNNLICTGVEFDGSTTNQALTKAGSWQSFLQSHQTIKQDGVTGATVNRFGTCSTAAPTAAKTVSVTSGTFTLEAGARVTVRFIYDNAANNPTLNVNSTGAKYIYSKGLQITTGSNKALLAGTVDFIYDGTQYHLIGNYIDSDTNTHRPIQVNGTEILGNNTTALNLKAGSNVSLSNSSGTVTIAAVNTFRPIKINGWDFLGSTGDAALDLQQSGHIRLKTDQSPEDLHWRARIYNADWIIFTDLTVYLNDLTWTQSNNGMYYSSNYNIYYDPSAAKPYFSVILGATVRDFNWLRGDIFIQPGISGSSSIWFLSNTGSFPQNAELQLRAFGIITYEDAH